MHVLIVCVRSDEPPELPATCDSEAASVQSVARPGGTPLQADTYLFCTITLFKVFLNIIISMSN